MKILIALAFLYIFTVYTPIEYLILFGLAFLLLSIVLGSISGIRAGLRNECPYINSNTSERMKRSPFFSPVFKDNPSNIFHNDSN